MKKNILSMVQKGLFVLIGLLVAMTIVYLTMIPNVQIYRRRTVQGYHTIKDITCTEIEDPKAPAGLVKEYHFVLEESIAHDTTLAFYQSHHYVEVFLEGEKIYSLYPADEVSRIKTTGSSWVMVPIYTSDAGREVTVRLTPVYEHYKDVSMEFMLGSAMHIFTEQLKNSLPELLVSLIVIFTGILLLCFAGYNALKKRQILGGMCGLAMLAISSGLWRVFDTKLSPFMGEGKPIVIYYISVLMLMLCVIATLRIENRSGQNRWKNIAEICSIAACFICAGQLVFQWLGIADIRESLTLTHGFLIVGALLLIGNSISGCKEKKPGDFAWILGVGILIDLVVFYIKGSSSGLLFVLVTILGYVLIEASRIIRVFGEQKHLLEEKETQLTLSRITTMYSQIRSHFVFNILNAISGMCKYDPEKADETVVRFSRYLRNNINIMEDDKLIPFMTDLQHLEDYFLLEQIRFGEKIEFVTDTEVENFMIPPLILQPLVENAIKHGLSKSPKGGIIMLRTWKDEDNILISIEDDGIGFDLTELEKEDSVGLKNIRFRLKHLMKGTLEIESELGKGTKATISIPGKEALLCEQFM